MKLKNKFGYCNFDISETEGACIYDLYIYAEYRKHGHAKRLICDAINRIRSSGYDDIIGIEASPKEDSISKAALVKFYKSLGLCVTNDTPVGEKFD